MIDTLHRHLEKARRSVIKKTLKINNTQGIGLIDPLGYLDFLDLLDSATMVLTDSGGIQS